MDIDVIGAGIGGLTTAIALQQQGLGARIFEQAGEIRPVGAGIIIANNGMQVYKTLGLHDAIEELGNPVWAMKVTDAQLQPISSIDLTSLEKKHQVRTVAIHRGQLQSVLAGSLQEGCLSLGHALQDATRQGAGFDLVFENGVEHTSAALVGADGLDSVVRTQLFEPSVIRNSFQLCWRGVTEYSLPEAYAHDLIEAWGDGKNFGFVQIDPTHVYWFAYGSVLDDEGADDEFRAQFAAFHPVVGDLMDATSQQDIHVSRLQDLSPLSSWTIDNACLLGDAAHAMTPNLGQGASQAIEDAFVLAQCLAKMDVNPAFQRYQKLRMPKAKQVVRASRNFGRVAAWKHPLAVKVRNTGLASVPQSLNQRRMSKFFELQKV